MIDSSQGYVLNTVTLIPLRENGNSVDIKDIVAGIYINECLTSAFMIGKLLVSDSADFINSFHIEGGEQVEIGITFLSSDNTAITEKLYFRIYNISNRVMSQKTQLYTLELISAEAILNEISKIYRSLEGNPNEIVNSLLRNDLGTTKPFYSSSSKFKMKMTGNGKTPFHIISMISSKSVPSQTNFNDDGKKGSSGFFFWESRKGYNFFSVDTICDNEGRFKDTNFQQETWGPYRENYVNAVDVNPKTSIIKSEFKNENNLQKSLRLGKYATRMIFFNLTTGQYSEDIYTLKDAYENMAKLGTQKNLSSLPVAGKRLANIPSRVMVSYLDHEAYYNDTNVASPETQDGSSSPNLFADRHRYYESQSIFRYQLMRNQTMTLLIPGNILISPGDKIDVRLRNKVPDVQLVRQPWDTESSGIYLIEDVSHQFVRQTPDGGYYQTTLGLLRDSHGFKTSNYGDS